MPLVVICGDSTIDNDVYVAGPDRAVRSHLARALSGSGWQAEIRARDGALAASVAATQLPAKADAIVVSVGGNDALGAADLIASPERRTLLDWGLALAEIQARFRADYARVLDVARSGGAPCLAFTIYRPNFGPGDGPPGLQRAGSCLLSIFNDVIAEECLRRRVALAEMRAIVAEPADYANAIEPGDRGGAKIAAAMAKWLRTLAD